MMPPAPYLTLSEVAKSQDSEIAAEMVTARFRVILDEGLSSHEKLQAVSQINDFLKLSINSDPDSRNLEADQKLVAQFHNLSLRVST